MQFLKKERASKLSVSTRRQQVKVGCTTCECNHQDGKEQNKQHPPKTGTNQQIADGKQQSLVNALEALRLDVASLKCSMKSGNEGNQNNARGGLETTPEGIQRNLPVYRVKKKGKTVAIFVGSMNITLEDARRDHREMTGDYIRGTGGSPWHNQRVPFMSKLWKKNNVL